MNARSIKEEVEHEIIISKSKFLGYLFPIKTEEEASDILQQIRKKHYNANHNCYAYVLGEKREIAKCSDDGEPTRTAGLPMIEVLNSHNITNVLAVVTRYFGGIKLGTGGLIRAYGSTVAKTLELATLTEIKKVIKISIVLPYNLFETVKYYIDKNNFEIDNTIYNENVEVDFIIDDSELDKVLRELTEMTNDKYRIEHSEVFYKEAIFK